MLEILRRPPPARATEMLQKDIGDAINEDEAALDKLGAGAPLLAQLFGPHIPRPSEVAEASRPTTEGKQAEPEEDTALDPVSQAGKDLISLLFANVSNWKRSTREGGACARRTKKRPNVITPVHRAMKPRIKMVRSMKL